MKRLTLLFSLVLATTFAYAQTRDLIALAQGDFLGMNALFDEKGKLFGYISLYDYGKSGDKTKKFEYVILDKNLNPFANKTFEGDITAGSYRGYISFDGKVVLAPRSIDASLVKQKELFTPSSMIIDLKTNEIKRKVFYEFDRGTFIEKDQHDTWKENRKESRAEKRENGFNYISYVVEIKEGGYLILEYEDHGSYVKNNSLLRYDENKKKQWRYEYNEDGSNSRSSILYHLAKDDKYFFGLLRERVRSNNKHYLLVIDMKTGKEVHKKEIPDPEKLLATITDFPTYSYGELDNDNVFEDKIVLVGRMTNGIYHNGISRLMINKQTFQADLQYITYKKDLKEHFKINQFGFMGNGYLLDPRDIFFLKDGSVGFLFEKYKPVSQYSAPKTTDMVYVHMNKDFQVADVKILEKEKSKWQNSDYLFSQNLNDDKDVVFFYRDYQKDDETKDKNWNLFINTFIDGKFKQDMIPISSKESYMIFPYIAKEGYILLQEFNKKAKYNRIRLERLNY